MKRLLVSLACAAVLAACSEREQAAKAPAAQPAPAPVAGDVKAGRILADTECKGCHGPDGGSIAPGIPHLAAQDGRYLLAALKAYREGKRSHTALKVIAERMSEADLRNVSAYYAGLPAVGLSPASGDSHSPYDRGRARAAACMKCHGEDGNSATPGVPNLAGQQARYLIIALQEYVRGERKSGPMHAVMRTLSPLDMEAVAIYFASQAPAQRPVGAAGDPAAGAALSAVCSGCHGLQGVSADSATPNLASQDFRYLVEAIKAYRTTRKRDKMRLYITGLGETEIRNIAAYYAAQKSGPAEKGRTLVRDLTEKCDRCHALSADNPALVVPRIAGQDRDYLVMALRAYRDDRRESTTMHKMSLPYGDAVIESIASYYASQPAK